MGFYFRKSLRMGPLRLNLSRRGVGVSAGVKGLRLGVNRRGSYLQAGLGGVYFRQQLTSTSKRTSHRAPRQTSVSQSAPPVAEPPSDLPHQRISTSFARYLPSAVAWRSVLVGVVLLDVLAIVANRALLPLAIIVAVAAVAAAYHWRVKPVHLVLSTDRRASFRTLCEALTGFFDVDAVWRVPDVDSVSRIEALAFMNGRDLIIDEPVPCLAAGSERIYFLPEAIAIGRGRQMWRFEYDELKIATAPMPFMESGLVPSDATTIQTTFLHANKDGGPDRRFADNPSSSVCAYQKVTLLFPGAFERVFLQSAPRDLQPLLTALSAMVSRPLAEPIAA